MSSSNLFCTDCGRIFSRREHLDRHILTHTNEKPFSCSRCNKCYARRDVFQKHLRTHDPSLVVPTSRRKNTHLACDTCHNRKVKCDLYIRPCSRCKAAGLLCTFSRGQSTDRPPPLVQSMDEGRDLAQSDGRRITSSTDDLQNRVKTTEIQESLAPSSTQLHFVGAESTIIGGAPDFATSDVFMSDPYLTIFDNNSFPILFPPLQDDFFGDLAADYGRAPLDFGTTELPDVSILRRHELYNTDDALQQKQFRLNDAYAKLNEYSTLSYPSRPASPRSMATHERYIQELGNLAPLTNDTVIINTFVGLFQTYIAPTFACFRRLRIDPSTFDGATLAMAAAGGLYCSALKSEVIATWLHHYSRRKLLTAVNGKQQPDLAQKFEILQTWVLTEIFAFLSGDKRNVSLLDIYHAQLVSAARACSTGNYDAPVDGGLGQVFHAVNLLECYRVVLLQRPPMLYPCSLPCGMTVFGTGSNWPEGSSKPVTFLSLVRLLTSPDRVPEPFQDSNTSVQVLCALSLLLPFNQRSSGSLYKLERGVRGSSHSSQERSHEFLELALQKWLSSHSSQPSPGTLMLFHTIHLSMYSSFAGIEHAAHRHLTQRSENGPGVSTKFSETPAADGPKGSFPKRDKDLDVGHISHQDQVKAVWHANKILSIAEAMKPERPLTGGARLHLLKESQEAQKGEVSHYSHAVYYASIILWKSSLSGIESSVDTISVLRRGIELLTSSPSRLAMVFKQTLQKLASSS